MSRALLAAVAMAVVAAPSLDAQTRPDFSGRWTLVADRGTPAGSSVFGDALTIGQTPTSLTIEAQLMRIQLTSGPGGSRTTAQPAVSVTTVYVSDGVDHPFGEVTAPADPSRVRLIQTYFAGQATDRIYRATWTRDQLVIMRHETFSLNRNQAEPLIMRRVIRQALALDQDGTLVVDSLIVADPVPELFFFNAQPAQPAPIPVRSVYRKAQ